MDRAQHQKLDSFVHFASRLGNSEGFKAATTIITKPFYFNNRTNYLIENLNVHQSCYPVAKCLTLT